MSYSLPNNETLLEISTRPYLYYLSQKYKTLINKLSLIPLEELDFLKYLRFNFIWFMGVWNNGKEGRLFDQADESRIKKYNKHLPGWTNEDVIGSPYSIYSYDPSPEIGTSEDLKWLKEELNKRDIKLILDFVPNHSSMDAPEIESNPEYYIRKGRIKSKYKLSEKDEKYIYNNAKIVKIPKEEKYDNKGFAYGRGLGSKHVWKDVRQYDYSNKKLWQFQLENLKKIAKYCDGIRCDVAWLILNEIFKRCFKTINNDINGEFWSFVISEIKKLYPNIIFIAEVFGKKWISDYLLKCGFNYVYDISPFDSLNKNNINEFIERITTLDDNYLFHSLHYTENHDLITVIENFEGNAKKANLATAIISFLPGIKMYNFGQFYGWKNTLCVQLRRILSYNINEDILKFYKILFHILKLDVFKNGKFYISLIDNLIFIKWINEKQIVLSYFNYNDFNQKGKMIINNNEIKEKNYEVKELIENNLCYLVKEEKEDYYYLDFDIEAYQMKAYLIIFNDK